MFLMRSAFWLAVVLYFLPQAQTADSAATLDTAAETAIARAGAVGEQLAHAAGVAFALCSTQPELCARAADLPAAAQASLDKAAAPPRDRR